MERKTRQYLVRQFNFKKVKEKDGNLYFNLDDCLEFSMAENFVYNIIYNIQNIKYQTVRTNEQGKRINTNNVEELVILKSDDIKETDNKKIALYQKAVREGIYIDGKKYLYSEKSASMTRTQKTVYVREDIKDKLEETITLGKKPRNTVTSKWLSTRGLMLSSCNLMYGIPRIAIIPDFEKVVYEDVKMVVPFIPETDEEKAEYEKWLETKKADEIYSEKSRGVTEKCTQEYLAKNYKTVSGDVYKTRNSWGNENRRVKFDELENFTCVKQYKNKLYPVYCSTQTEEKATYSINKYSLGYDLVEKDNYPNELNCFDGMGLISFEYVEKIAEFLGISNTNAIQGRLPYIKGLFIKFNFKKYFKEVLKTETITDIWNNPHNVDDLDLILTESCFKAKLDIDDEGKKHWLFSSMKDYYTQLKKYKFKHFGIAKYAKDELDLYTPMTYQLLNSLNLKAKDLVVLSKETGKTIKEVLRVGDTAKVKHFLDMIDGDYSINEDDDLEEEKKNEDKTKLDYIKKAIELNERMIFDKEIQRFIYRKCKEVIREMMIGRIRIPSRYMYITGDVIAFCEWAAYREEEKVKGFLDYNEFYCSGVNEEQIMVRYPLTHYSEVKLAPFVSRKNEYLEHLHNLIQFNTHDLTLTQLAG